MSYTVVLGVDENHVEHLQTVFPSWSRHKPSLFKQPFVIFYDRGMKLNRISRFVELFTSNVRYQIWPPEETKYEGFASLGTSGRQPKWWHPQRNKMLSGFVHVPAMTVETPYWLKLDLDVVATGKDDWVDESWFEKEPAIISHPWGYTKPPGQMIELDYWFNNRVLPKFPTLQSEPLNLMPEPGTNLVKHKRIISFCSFFQTSFTRFCADLCTQTVGEYKLPVPSQDGVLWYLAKRLEYDILTTNMKRRGWDQQSKLKGIKQKVKEAMK